MEQPLFDNQPRSSKIAEHIVMGVVFVWMIFSIVICVVYAIKNGIWEHFAFALLLFLVSAILVILIWWWRQGDLDPKFQYLIAFSILVVIFAGAAANAYVWKAPPDHPSADCAKLFSNSSFYDWASQSCVQISNLQACMSLKKDFCIKMSTPTYGICLNCSVTSNPKPPSILHS
eukprot:TRINITY_DN6535_c0_g1_i10.p1 TRINITY_DN6535_c0_g1~~TRINITY_DN6535_c0_g1_i10.p1  ORF type:complete len:174 (-),score=20.67 TRINITY_DN6535_c0_g1_i10:250-771(-)